MELKLENKRVLVTGSTGGIGAGIASKFAEEGATVIVNGRRAEAAEAVAVSIREAGGKAIVAGGDLSTDEGVEKVLTEVGATVGGVHASQSRQGVYLYQDSKNRQHLGRVLFRAILYAARRLAVRARQGRNRQ